MERARRVVLAADLGPPTVALIASALGLWVAADAAGVNMFRSASWVRWDSGAYLAIAARGYHLLRCPGSYPPHTWCGDAGWFPGYPWLVAAVADVGAPRNGAATVISWAFAFAALTLLWHGFLRELPRPGAEIGLAFAAFVPGGVFTRAVFPMSITTFLLVLCLLMLRRRRLWWAALAGGLAAVCYPTAILLAVPVTLSALVEGERAWPRRAVRALGAAAIVAAGTLSSVLAMRLQTGSWDAYFQTQAKFEHGFHEPFANIWASVKLLVDGAHGSVGISAAQVTFDAVLMLGVIVAVTVSARARPLNRVELILGGTALLFWLVPLTQAHVDYWRGDTLLAPAAVLLARLPRALALLAVGTAATLFVFMGMAFFQGTLA